MQPLYLFVVSLISFIRVIISAYRSFVSLDRLILRYLIIFVAMIFEIVSLTSLSDF